MFKSRVLAWATALAVAIALGVWLYFQNQPLKTRDAPRGLMSLQLAGHPDAATRIIKSWDDKQRARARTSLLFDYALIAAYGFGMYGACRAAGALFSVRPRELATRIVAPLQLWAAGMDALEDLGQLGMLHGFANGMTWTAWLSVPTALCAALKWVFLFAGLATIATGLAARVLGSARAALGRGGPSPNANFERVLDEELDATEKSRNAVGRAVPVPPANGKPLERADGARLAGLAFSGGGIRSATVCLGMIQSLCDKDMLRRFDYLSTVSGGGYIGAWLAAWSSREPGGVADVEARLKAEGACSPQVEFLRTYSNYLTPRKGFFTVDTWAAVATYLRNLMLNLFIFVLLVWAGIALVMLLTRYGWENVLPMGVASVLLLWFATCTATLGVTVRVTNLDQLRGLVRWAQTGAGAAVGIVASLFAAAATGGFWIIGWAFDNSDDVLTIAWAGIAIVGAIVTWLVSWYYGEKVNRENGLRAGRLRARTIALFTVTVLVAGLLAAGLVLLSVEGLARFDLTRWFTDKGSMRAAMAMVLSPAVVLGGVGVGIVFGIGLIGNDYSDKGREWWSRILGWLLAITLAWTVIVGGVFVVPGLIIWAGESDALSPNKVLAAIWAGLAFALTQVGKGQMPAGFLATAKRTLLTVGAYLVIAGFLIICTWSFFSFYTYTLECRRPQALADCLNGALDAWLYPGQGSALAAFIFCLLLALILAARVDINRFSLHDFYKNRLVRCYLGASNPDRAKQLDQVSGFAENDEIPLHVLRDLRPYPIVNTALNIVRGKRLAWQERQAASFVFTPRYCGFELPGPRPQECFRQTEVYAAGAVTLGSAMSISGAAVNPQHGRGTTPVFMLFATLLNLRTGVWMPNSRYPIMRPSPPIAGGYLLAELFGWTDEDKHYVHLSDGGHFDNLGVYELVRRRCRLIVAVDATEDDKRGFEDLASCIRRCEVDFGARIKLDVSDLVPEANLLSRAAVVRGTIDYAPLGSLSAKGTIIYVKSSRIHETAKSAALFSYGRIDARFPHHSTVDQWFDESRFESYRALGRALGEVLTSRFATELA